MRFKMPLSDRLEQYLDQKYGYLKLRDKPAFENDHERKTYEVCSHFVSSAKVSREFLIEDITSLKEQFANAANDDPDRMYLERAQEIEAFLEMYPE